MLAIDSMARMADMRLLARFVANELAPIISAMFGGE